MTEGEEVVTRKFSEAESPRIRKTRRLWWKAESTGSWGLQQLQATIRMLQVQRLPVGG
jgi:hypothetical protein